MSSKNILRYEGIIGLGLGIQHIHFQMNNHTYRRHAGLPNEDCVLSQSDAADVSLLLDLHLSRDNASVTLNSSPLSFLLHDRKHTDYPSPDKIPHW